MSKMFTSFTNLSWLIVSTLGLSFLLVSWNGYAQKPKDDEKSEPKRPVLHHTVETGLALGGQVSNDLFVYKSGFLGQYTAELEVSSRVSYGVGFGVEKFNNERFIPVFASFRGLLKKKDSAPFLTAQLGYALASNPNFHHYANYRYLGGLFFSPGYGYKISVKDKYALLFSIHYKHQFAQLQYKTFDRKIYRQTLNFDLVSFRVGIQL